MVINYDLAWTASKPAQRADRILCLWHDSRTIELYAFVPYASPKTLALPLEEDYHTIQRVAKCWATLITHHSWSSQILELPSLTIDSQ